MIFIDQVSVTLQGFPGIHADFELGDLTIFIGKPNAGKTRILDQISSKLENAERSPLEGDVVKFREKSKGLGLALNDKVDRILTHVFVTNPRSRMTAFEGLGTKLGKTASVLRKVDPQIKDLGTRTVELTNKHQRPLEEQGSGVASHTQMLQGLFESKDVVLIDEPEVSQFPYGKIAILDAILTELKEKQIIIATHDPTIINQYLIKQVLKRENLTDKIKIRIYSFNKNKFNGIDFSSSCDPEIHVGYLNQGFSGKPVHLIVEGQTEFFALQALLTKYCVYHGVRDFPKFINKISLSHLGGGQWPLYLPHIPSPEYYKVFILLDGEYESRIKKMQEEKEIEYFNLNLVPQNQISDEKVNLAILNSKDFDTAFEKVFNEKFVKPFALGERIWKMTNEDFQAIDFTDPDFDLIKKIIDWCLEMSGVDTSFIGASRARRTTMVVTDHR